MSGLNGSGESDGGPATLAIEEREGAIVLFIGETYAILPPEQAMEVGQLMTQYGYHAKTGQDVEGKKVMSEQIRNKLFQRVSLVINNLQERKKEPMFIAKEIVDIVLSEVL
jgi:hypothetical protein